MWAWPERWAWPEEEWPAGHVTAVDQPQRQHCIAKGVARVCASIPIIILLTHLHSRTDSQALRAEYCITVLMTCGTSEKMFVTVTLVR